MISKSPPADLMTAALKVLGSELVETRRSLLRSFFILALKDLESDMFSSGVLGTGWRGRANDL